ncbi:glycine betaine ABC transporter substrate-binding protein [Ochrobactrum vermis]|uniref:Glycine betaine ABC transporter substrate-binding protein n=1 Tax=Ochrobactrum vermis TaxID=1827297 RepID=A0ABU8P964_9HYPH|nr:glycine betaine ABC transporter substrate-binding protein [Ochrobactrum vermis]PQZ29340.1 amino acid-binding protein [Ochrobactrum vermis]
MYYLNRKIFLVTTLLVGLPAIPSIAADLVIAMPNWPSGQASANIMKVVIKDQLGIDAKVEEMGTLIAFAGLETGAVDVHPEIWRPNLDNLVKKYVDEEKKIALSPKSMPAWQGICATRAAVETVGIRDINDLNDPEKTAKLDTNGDGKGEMWVGASSWSMTPIEKIRANSYGYSKNLDLLETSEEVGMAAVDAAEAIGQPMVFACYAPHYVFELHDIQRLTEPEHDASQWRIIFPTEDPAWFTKSIARTAWSKGQVQIGYAASLEKRYPDVVKVLNKIDFTPEEASQMAYALEVEKRKPYDYAVNWVASHKDRIKGWVQ